MVLFRGLASLIGSPMVGAVYDQTQRFDIPFYLAGAFLMASGFVGTIVQIAHNKKVKRENQV